MKSYKARWAGQCYVCKTGWKVGDPITECKVGSHRYGYRHDDCQFEVPVYKEPEGKPNEYQGKILAAVACSQKNLIIEARAGTGKTWLLQKVVYLLNAMNVSSVGYFAFNSKLAVEASEKLDPRMCSVGTFHSVLGQYWKSTQRNRCRLDKYKLNRIVESHVPSPNEKGISKQEKAKRLQLVRKVEEVVSKMKSCLLSAEDVAERFAVDLEDKELDLCEDILEACAEATGTMDFDDMIWLPYRHRIKFPTKRVVLVDEAQDLNPVMVEALKSGFGPNTRFIFVGDRKQSIYAFRGADPYMMDRIQADFECDVLGQPVTFRCPQSHTRYIRSLGHVPDFVSTENAKEGTLQSLSRGEETSWLDESWTVICRTNAPLVGLAFQLIRCGKKAQVAGRQFGEQIKNYIKAHAGRSIQETLDNLEEALQKELEKLEKSRSPNRDAMIQAAQDQFDCVEALAGFCQTTLVGELYEQLDNIFSDNVQGIHLTSIHKAKGGTFKRTVLLNYERIQLRAETAEEAEQEANARYVALSRATDDMILLYEEQRYPRRPGQGGETSNPPAPSPVDEESREEEPASPLPLTTDRDPEPVEEKAALEKTPSEEPRPKQLVDPRTDFDVLKVPESLKGYTWGPVAEGVFLPYGYANSLGYAKEHARTLFEQEGYRTEVRQTGSDEILFFIDPDEGLLNSVPPGILSLYRDNLNVLGPLLQLEVLRGHLSDFEATKIKSELLQEEETRLSTFTPEQEEVLRKLHCNDGWSLKRIAAASGRPEKYLRRKLEEMGI